MKTSMKILTVVGAIAVLLVAGLALAMTTTNVQANDQTPQVSIDDQVPSPTNTPAITDNGAAMHNFTVTVGANVEGKKVPMADALVIIYSVNVTKDAATNTTTIVLEKVADKRTDLNGVADFNLAEGKYIVIAHYHGLNGFGKVNLTDDMSRQVMLHNWNGEFLNGLEGSKKVTITMER